jgi:serine/threonine protein kinase
VQASPSLRDVSDGELPPVPRKLGRYRVLFELGRGGMATVYLAVTQSSSGVSKLVALKALLPEYASEADASAMFLDEARLAVQLNHGNVVRPMRWARRVTARSSSWNIWRGIRSRAC